MYKIHILSTIIFCYVMATAVSADPPPWTNLAHWQELRANPTLANAEQLLGEPTDRLEMGKMFGMYFGGRAGDALAYITVMDDNLWISSPDPAKLDKWLCAKNWTESKPADDLSKWSNPAAWEPLKGGVAPSLVVERLGPPTWFIISPEFEQWSYGRYTPVQISGEVLIMKGKVAMVKPPNENALRRLNAKILGEDTPASSPASVGDNRRASTSSLPSMDSAQPKIPATHEANNKTIRTEATTLPANGLGSLPSWVLLPKEAQGFRYIVICLGLDEWCPPCVQLASPIRSLRDRFMSMGIGFVGGIASGKPSLKYKRFIQDIPLLDPETTNKILKHLDRDHIPFAVIVDTNMKVLWSSGEGVDVDKLESFLLTLSQANEAQFEQWRQIEEQGNALIHELSIAEEFSDRDLKIEIRKKLANLDYRYARQYASSAVAWMLQGDARSRTEAWNYGLLLLRKYGYLPTLVDVIRTNYIKRLQHSEQVRCYEELASLGEAFGNEAVMVFIIRNDGAPQQRPTFQDGKRLIDNYGSHLQAMCDFVDYLLKQGSEKRDLNLALQAALAANRAANGRDADILALVATVCFEAGDMHEAVRYQTMAVEKESWPDNKAELAKRLEYYQLKLKQTAGAATPPAPRAKDGRPEK